MIDFVLVFGEKVLFSTKNTDWRKLNQCSLIPEKQVHGATSISFGEGALVTGSFLAGVA